MVWAFGLEGPDAPKLGTRLVLLALCDNAGAKADRDDWEIAWPSVARLARKSQISERQTQRAIKQLDSDGLITCVGTLANGVRQWRINLHVEMRDPGGDNLSGGDIGGSEGVTPASEGGDVGVTQNRKEPQQHKEPCEGEASALEEGGSELYREPATPGSAAAPWLAIELARLMRGNDPKVPLPVALRKTDLNTRTLVSSDSRTASEAKAKMFVNARERLDTSHPSVKPWLDAMRLLIDRDERDGREVVKVLRWSQEDDFWKGNILSAPTFRKQYPKLRARWLEEGGDDRPRAAPANRRPPERGPATAAQLDAMERKS